MMPKVSVYSLTTICGHAPFAAVHWGYDRFLLKLYNFHQSGGARSAPLVYSIVYLQLLLGATDAVWSEIRNDEVNHTVGTHTVGTV